MTELYTLPQIMRCVFHGPLIPGMTLLAQVLFRVAFFFSIAFSLFSPDIDHPSKGSYSCRNVKLLTQTRDHASFLSGEFFMLKRVQGVFQKT